MMVRGKVKLLALMVCFALLVSAPIQASASAGKTGEATVQKKEENTYKGKIVGISRKAQTISIEHNKKTEMVKFDDATQGMEHAKKGEAAIIQFEIKGKDKLAVNIKPKLAKLPEGVVEMQPDELAGLIELGPAAGNYFLVDSRPKGRYDEGCIPTAVSIPVSKMKEKGAELLPPEKDKLLIFYCGGPT